LRAHVVIRQAGGFELPPFPVNQVIAYLEWSLNRCVFSRFFPNLLLHGGVLERDGDALIIVGESGAGKSTLSAALCLNGWRLLSDELTIISATDGSLTGLARPVALKNAAIDLIKSLSEDAHIGPISRDTPKGDVAHMRPPVSSVSNVGQPAKPACFVFVQFENGAPIRVQQVPKARAFMSVAQNAALNYGSLGASGFITLSRAIDSAVCFDFRYGDIHEAIDFFGSGSWKSTAAHQGTPA
jgi:HprK-related kinase A